MVWDLYRHNHLLGFGVITFSHGVSYVGIIVFPLINKIFF